MELRRLDFHDVTVRELVYPAGTRQARHDHDYGNISVVFCGEMLERTDTGEYRGRSCSVVVKPAATVHANEVPGCTGVVTLSLQYGPRSAFARQLGEWRWFEADDETARAALALRMALRGGAGVEARALDFSHRLLAKGAAAERPPRWFEDLRSILDRTFADPIRFDRLARAFGMHPVYVSRAFRRYAGISMRDYVHRLRMREARHRLASTSHSATAIALDTGYVDGSHFARAFNRSHGVSPAAFRRLCKV
ncbi:MAG TPA: AraC family transcriptional regulator [Thermoanaerobaculia bacterium]|nr:AraC family transcriptional regulator [Thermoanaerobaculia bacterium]